nr:uncharacterized protein LOC117842483 isoform X2 [Setaria viridis]
MMLQRSTSCEGKARSRATKQGRVTGPGDPESAVCRDTRAHAGRVEEECDEQWDEEDDDREDFDQRIQTYILHCRKKRRKIITIAAAMLGLPLSWLVGLGQFMTCGFSKMQLTSLETSFRTHLKASSTLLTPVTQTDRDILHPTKEPSTICRSLDKGQCQEVKKNPLTTHILHFVMSLNGRLEF